MSVIVPMPRVADSRSRPAAPAAVRRAHCGGGWLPDPARSSTSSSAAVARASAVPDLSERQRRLPRADRAAQDAPHRHVRRHLGCRAARGEDRARRAPRAAVRPCASGRVRPRPIRRLAAKPSACRRSSADGQVDRQLEAGVTAAARPGCDAPPPPHEQHDESRRSPRRRRAPRPALRPGWHWVILVPGVTEPVGRRRSRPVPATVGLGLLVAALGPAPRWAARAAPSRVSGSVTRGTRPCSIRIGPGAGGKLRRVRGRGPHAGCGGRRRSGQWCRL